MKKLNYFAFLLVLGLFGVCDVNAATLKVTTNKNTVVVGSTVNVTVAVNGNDADAWEYCLDYDSSIFSVSSSTVGGLGSTTCLNLGGINTGGKNVTFTLKAKKSGSSTITVKNASVLNYEAKEVLSSKESVTIRAKTQAEIEASYSTNANLSGLRVVDHVITPDFNKDTLEYNLEVENEIDKVTIKATKADSSATISGTGEKELTEGLNKFEIVVTAEKGNKKTYVVNVTRKELNPIHVDVDGFDYTIVRKADAIEAPTYYVTTEIEIQGELVPAFNSDITGYTLVGLKDEEGNISLYRYLEDKNQYISYKQVGVEGVVFIPLNTDVVLEDYTKTKNVTINNVNVKAYCSEEKSDYVLVYGMNASTGETSWFKYDTKGETLQRYVVEEKEEVSDIYFLLTIVFACISGLGILLVIILIATNSKVRKKNAKLISMLQALRDANRDNSKNKLKEEIESVDEVDVEVEKKEIAKDEHDKLREKQEEFLETSENEIIEDDVDLEESTPVKKTKRGRKKKES